MLRNDSGELFRQHPAARVGVIRVHDRGEGVDGFSVHKHVQLDQLVRLIAGGFVVHASVAAGD